MSNSFYADAKNVNITERTRSLGALLRLPYQAIHAYTYRELARTGFADIRPAHSNVFRNILPAGSRVTDLAERAALTKQSMGYLVDDLDDLGYVQLNTDPDDGRAKLVRLTKKGEDFQRAALTVSRRLETKMATLIGQSEAKKLRELLEKLVDRLDELA